MQIFDTTPHRARLRSFRGVGRTPLVFEASPPTLAAGGLATAIALATLVAMAAPRSGRAARPGAAWPGAYALVQVPVMPGSEEAAVRVLPSIALMVPPVVGTLIAALGFRARRKEGLPLGPAIGMVACALAMACWWLHYAWMALAYGGPGAVGP